MISILCSWGILHKNVPDQYLSMCLDINREFYVKNVTTIVELLSKTHCYANSLVVGYTVFLSVVVAVKINYNYINNLHEMFIF